MASTEKKDGGNPPKAPPTAVPNPDSDNPIRITEQSPKPVAK